MGLSVAILLISNLASTKMFDFFGTGFVMDGGAIIFPVGYVLGDVIVEFYGYARARRIIILTVAMNLLAALTFLIVGLLPPGEGWEHQGAFQAILGFMPRLVIASLIAFLVGQLLNASIFQRLKDTRFGGRFLWWRALGSSLVGNAIDSIIFTVIAFAGTISNVQLVALVGLAFLMKMVGEAVLLPVTYGVVRTLRRAVPDSETLLGV
ncbi:MAG: queuosine precursor transporter [Cellulomonadaceae bacterium]|nr:queuosine precursor transporter [Cellulomonadaceae bacterium]